MPSNVRQLCTTVLFAALLGASAASAATGAAAGPEAVLAEIVGDIKSNHLGRALRRTEALLEQHPNFRLAHLIKGDLLLARTRPLSTIGNAEGVPAAQLADLRAEAIARIDAFRNRPGKGMVPRSLLALSPEQKHAVVMDARRSRLYVYRNDRGNPRFVTDYYVSQGKAGMAKVREGDKRTPIGVYFVTSSIPATKLPEFYGSGAFPINYPNEWDRRLGRNGYGIWLHGTPPDTYARPPLASDGCMVLANQDLDALADYVDPGQTPVIISNDVEWLSPRDWQAERNALSRRIERWRSDWESRDSDRLLSHYADDFHSDAHDLEEWSQQRRQINASKEWASVSLHGLSMFRSPGKDELVVVTFEQRYRSNNLNSDLKKRQYWVKRGGQWKIAYEGPA